MMIKKLMTLILMLTLTACSLLSPVRSDYTTYVLRTLPCSIRLPATHAVLYVSDVDAEALYDTDYMAYSTHPLQVEYYAKNKWADTPAKMLKPLIIQTLIDTHHFRAITTTANANYNYVLNTKIVELRQVFTCTGSYVIFRLQAEIIRVSSGKIIASQEFCSAKIMCAANPYSGVVAANKAVADVLAQLAIFSSRAR